jgi:hypothetical protein
MDTFIYGFHDYLSCFCRTFAIFLSVKMYYFLNLNGQEASSSNYFSRLIDFKKITTKFINKYAFFEPLYQEKIRV